MADAIIDQPTPEEVQEATSLGWADKDKWRGDPERWVDAKSFLKSGMGIHHVRTQNEKLQGNVSTLEERLQANEAALKAANAAIAALEESHEADVKEQVAAARADLKAQLASASKDGDHEQVAELTDKLTQLNVADDAPKSKGATTEDEPATPKIHPEVKEWYSENQDFLTSKRKVALANVIANEMREKGDKRIGKAFLDDVRTEVEKEFGTAGAPRVGAGKVEAGGGGGNRGGGGGGGGDQRKTYADLPADAKAACDKAANRLVGPNRAHKDIGSWRNSYVKQYFGETA